MHGGFGTYKGKFEALLSAHYTAAVILHDRALTLAQFEPGRYDDPELRRFAAERVEAYGRCLGRRFAGESRYRDGRLARRCRRAASIRSGSFENPLSRTQIAQKFRTYARGVLPDANIAEVIDAVEQLEDFGPVGRLMDLLGGAARARWRPRSDIYAGSHQRGQP